MVVKSWQQEQEDQPFSFFFTFNDAFGHAFLLLNDNFFRVYNYGKRILSIRVLPNYSTISHNLF